MRMFKLIAVLAVFVATLAVGQTVSAATLVVNNGGACDDVTGTPAYCTIQSAIDAASNGDTIQVRTGTYAGAVVAKGVHLRAQGQVRIDTGPFSHATLLRAGFLFDADGAGSGAIIEGFQIVGTMQGIGNGDDDKLDFGVFSRGADNVTIRNNSLTNVLQGITNWHGNGWTISQNSITDLHTRCGGAIGILVGSFDGAGAVGSVVSDNTVSGTLNVDASDCGGYVGPGIVLFSDHRSGRTGGEVSGNMVVRNKVALVSDTPGVVDVVAIELTDTRDDLTIRDVFDNAVKFNDLGGTTMQIALTPSNLDEYNDISMNGGEDQQGPPQGSPPGGPPSGPPSGPPGNNQPGRPQGVPGRP